MYFRTATTVPQRSVKELLQLWESIAEVAQVEQSRSQELRPMTVLTGSAQGPNSPKLVDGYRNPSSPIRQQSSALTMQPERLVSPQAVEANSFKSPRVSTLTSPIAFSPTQVLNRDGAPIPEDLEGLKTLMGTLQGELEAVRRELEATKRARAANPHIVSNSISEPLSPQREQALNQISDWLENEVQTVQTRLSTMAVSPTREQPQIYVQIPSPPSKTQVDMMIPPMLPQKPQADPDDTANMKWLRGMVETLALSQLQFQQQLLQQQQQQQRVQQQPSPLQLPLQSPSHAQASFDVNGAAHLVSSEPPFTPNSNDYVSASSSVIGASPSRPATAASPSRPGTASSSTRPESGYLTSPAAVSIQTANQGEGGGGARALSARPQPQSKYQRFFSGRERSGSFNSFFSASSLDDSDYEAYPTEQEEFPPVQQHQQQQQQHQHQQQQALAVPQARSRSASRSGDASGGGERVRSRSNSAAADQQDGGYGSSPSNTSRRGSSSAIRGTSLSPNVRFLDQALSVADDAYYDDEHDDYNHTQIPYTPAESRRESEVSASRKSPGPGGMKGNHRLAAQYDPSSPETESSVGSPGGGGGYGYTSSDRDSEDELNLHRLMKMRRSWSQAPPSDGQGRGYASSDVSSSPSSSSFSSSNSNSSRDYSRRSQTPAGFRPSLTVLNESTRRSQEGVERGPASEYSGGDGGRNRSGSLGSRGKNEQGWGSSPALNRLAAKDPRAMMTPMRQRQHSDESFMVMADKRTSSFASLNVEDEYGPPPSRGGNRESYSRSGGRPGSGWDDRESRNNNSSNRDSYARRSGYERERESRSGAEYRESYSRSGRREEEYFEEGTEYRESYSRGGGGRERERTEYEREQREEYRESYSRGGRERGGDDEWEQRSERGERQSLYRESLRGSRASLYEDGGGSVGGSRNSLYSNSGAAGKEVLVAIPVARPRSNSTGTGGTSGTGGNGTVRRPGIKFKDPDPTPTPRLAVVRM